MHFSSQNDTRMWCNCSAFTAVAQPFSGRMVKVLLQALGGFWWEQKSCFEPESQRLVSVTLLPNCLWVPLRAELLSLPWLLLKQTNNHFPLKTAREWMLGPWGLVDNTWKNARTSPCWCLWPSSCPAVPRGIGNVGSNPGWAQDGAPQGCCGKIWEQAVGFSNDIPSALCLSPRIWGFTVISWNWKQTQTQTQIRTRKRGCVMGHARNIPLISPELLSFLF